MITFTTVVFFVALVGISSAGTKCSNGYYKGKKCASTTNYADYHKGACGCGPASNDNQFGWNHGFYVVAANANLFDGGGSKGWCGSNCGKCIRLTTTGGYVDGQGGPTSEGQTHVFMITNLCPNEWPNLSWCSQTSDHPGNQYGYTAHFDLENGDHQIDRLHWKNPEVTWEWTNCGRQEYLTPDDGIYQQCQCANGGRR